MGLVGKIEYGTWTNGSSIYKDSKGYYYVAVNAEGMYKKHLKSWKPKKDAPRLCFVDKKWKTCKLATRKLATRKLATRKTKAKGKAKRKTRRV
jgi:hypothetical protein